MSRFRFYPSVQDRFSEQTEVCFRYRVIHCCCRAPVGRHSSVTSYCLSVLVGSNKHCEHPKLRLQCRRGQLGVMSGGPCVNWAFPPLLHLFGPGIWGCWELSYCSTPNNADASLHAHPGDFFAVTCLASSQRFAAKWQSNQWRRSSPSRQIQPSSRMTTASRSPS